jgi:hypothetical protein
MGDPPSDPGVNVSDNSPHESFASLQLPLKFVGRKGVVPAADAKPGAVTPKQSAIAPNTPTHFISDSFVFAIFHMLKHYEIHVLIVQGEKFIP